MNHESLGVSEHGRPDRIKNPVRISVRVRIFGPRFVRPVRGQDFSRFSSLTTNRGPEIIWSKIAKCFGLEIRTKSGLDSDS